MTKENNVQAPENGFYILTKSPEKGVNYTKAVPANVPFKEAQAEFESYVESEEKVRKNTKSEPAKKDADEKKEVKGIKTGVK